jgi:uncharacterized protein YggU (UPF0235/DUF167 family)
MIDVFAIGDGAGLRLKVVPGSSRDRLMGELDGALKLAVSAPPERGRANRAVIALLARCLGLRPPSIRIERGTTNAFKTCAVSGVTVEQLRDALQRALESKTA